MNMLYNSDSFAVVQFDVPAVAEASGAGDLKRGGYEIVDKPGPTISAVRLAADGRATPVFVCAPSPGPSSPTIAASISTPRPFLPLRSRCGS